MDRESRIESSVPVQSRVSVVTLAELEMYWGSKGVSIATMSQLLCWSIDMLRNILASNNQLPQVVESVAEAHNYLDKIGLYQPSMRERSMKKIANAIGFENLRLDGIDPKDYAPQHYNMVHRKNTLKVPEPIRLSQEEVRAKWRKEQAEGKRLGMDAMMEVYKEIEDKEIREDLKKQLEDAKNGGFLVVAEEPKKAGEGFSEGISDEELKKYNEERDREVRARENAPIDMEFLKSQVVKK